MSTRKLTRKAFLKTLAGAGATLTIASPGLSVAGAARRDKPGASGMLLAGAAKLKLTPPPALLGDYRKADPHFDGDVELDLYARIIVLGNELGARLLLLSADLHSIPRYDELVAVLGRKYGIDRNACLLSGTLNQQAFTLDSRQPVATAITSHLHERIVAGVGEAIAALQPAQMALEQGVSDINVHFGRSTRLGFIEMPDYGRFADKQLGVLRIDDLNGRTLALLVNYGVQSNMMYAGSRKLSGDLAGAISGYVERRLGCVCAWTVGAAADIHPVTTAALSYPVFDSNGTGRVEATTISEQATGRLRDYLASVQGLDILKLHDGMTRFTRAFGVRCDDQEVVAAGTRGRLRHRLHLAVVNEDIAFAAANSIAAARLGALVKEALPYRTLFLAAEGNLAGYVVDQETDPAGIAGRNSVAADPWESEKIYVRGFRRLAGARLAQEG